MSRFLLVAFEDGIEELEDELLLLTQEEFDLLELSLELRLRAGLGARGVRLASQKFGDEQSADEEKRGGQSCNIAILGKSIATQSAYRNTTIVPLRPRNRGLHIRWSRRPRIRQPRIISIDI